MAVIKCKMCGGSLQILEDSSVCECEYCGTRQTVPKADDEKKLTLFSRAGRLLRSCEFDKAAGVFETIVADFPQEAEAYWGLVLCKYGIEYVDDPATGKKVPTCHRSSFDSVLDDANFEQACENADAIARRVYRDEARAIEALRQSIIEVSGREEPYDVFISYKETDEHGERTLDSVIAQDIYTELTDRGYRVFFSRISLENRLGVEYEPYIFAALNSAKVMLVVGTDYEHFDAVWVKNEWSRFLKLIAKGEKKTLIPVFKNMDAYDMPKDFLKLSAQDMGKLGAMQDLVRGVEKILGKKNAPETSAQPQQIVQQVIQGGGPNVTALVKRGQQALEDGDWDKAKDFYDQVLSMDAENGEAFLGLALAAARCRDLEGYVKKLPDPQPEAKRIVLPRDEAHAREMIGKLAVPNYLAEGKLKFLYAFEQDYTTTLESQTALAADAKARFDGDRNLARALRYARGEQKTRLTGARDAYFAALDEKVRKAKAEEEAARTAAEQAYCERVQQADEEAARLQQEALDRRERDYQDACALQKKAKNVEELHAAENALLALGAYKDADERARELRERAEALKKQLDAEKEERRRKEAAAAERKKKRIIACIAAAAVLVLAAILILTKVIIPAKQYKTAEAMFEAGQYQEAIAAFEGLGEYKDAPERVNAARTALKEQNAASYAEAEALLEVGDKMGAAFAFEALGDYRDARERSFALWEEIAQRETVSAGDDHTVGLRSDGTVLAVGWNSDGQCDVSGWTDIVAISAGDDHTVGLRSDGTVLAVGWNSDGQCDVSGWTDIVAVSAGTYHRVGLRSDGTVLAVGINLVGQCEVSGWTDIVAVSAGGYHTVGLRSDGTVLAVGSNGNGQCDVSGWTDIVAVSAGAYHTVGLRSDGTVLAAGSNLDGRCDVSGWTDIVAVSAGGYHTVGLRSDGTVLAVGSNGNGQCDVSGWTDIVAISAGDDHTVGLRSDGTVLAVGWNSDGQCDVSGWTDIVAVSAGGYHTVGLRSDGTVLAVGSNGNGQCDVSGWTDIVAVSAGAYHTVGLRSDGTVLAVGSNFCGECEVSGWTDIVAVSAGGTHTVGLRSDGTVVAVGYNDDGRCEVSGWRDIVAVSAGAYHTVGLRSDGTVLAAGSNSHGQCDVSSWRDIKLPD